MTSKKHSGFTIIEVIVSSALIASLTAFNLEVKANEEKYKKAEAFAADLGIVLQSFDKRIFLDGNRISTGVWDRTWDTTETVVTEMLGKELVAHNNSVCGDPSLGWKPTLPTNDTEALVPCNLFNPNKIPFNFSLTGKRGGNATDKTIISDWSIRVFHKTDVEFYNNYHLYPVIAQQVKLRTPLKMTGSLKTLYINRVNDDEITLNQCYKAGVNCSIELRYETSKGSYFGEDSYLRVDGSNAMRNSLLFAVDASAPQKCPVQDTPSTTKEVECGLAFDANTEDLDVIADELFARGLKLVDSESAVPVIVTCRDEDGVSAFCGIGVSGDSASPSSVKAKAYLNSMIANESMQLRNNLGNLVFDVDSNGDLYAKGKIDVDGSISTKGNITSEGTILSRGDISTESNLLAKGGATVYGAVVSGSVVSGTGSFSGTLTTGGQAAVGGELSVTKKSTFSDDISASKSLKVNDNIESSFGDVLVPQGVVNAKGVTTETVSVNSIVVAGDLCAVTGEIARDATGGLLSCMNGKWASSGGISVMTKSVDTVGTVSHPVGYKLISLGTDVGSVGVHSIEAGASHTIPVETIIDVPQHSACGSNPLCPTEVSATCSLKITDSTVSGCSGVAAYNSCSYYSSGNCHVYKVESAAYSVKIKDLLYMK